MRRAAVAVASLLLAGCSSSAVPPAGTGPSSSTTGPTTSTTVAAGAAIPCGVVPNAGAVLTSGSEPCALTTRVGVTLHLSLDRGFVWDDPRPESGVVAVRDVARPTAAGGLDADLVALSAGQTTVVSTGGIACAPGQPCPALARMWGLHVTVVAGPGPRTTLTTEADSGRTVTLARGDGLSLTLSGQSLYRWSEPTATDGSAVRRLTVTSGTSASATFLAVDPGAARITATADPVCYPRCLLPGRSFQLEVTVTG